MAGRHAVTGNTRRTTALIAIVLVALGVGGAVAFSLSTGDQPTRNAAGTQADLAASRAADAARADRGEARPSDSASPSASPSPAAAPSKSAGPSPSKKTTSKSTAAGPTTVTSKGSCRASYYDTGSRTANGERFDPDGITAAHKTLPFNTRVRVTNRGNGKSVVVRINDRGPFIEGRCIDLSRGAFKAVANLSAGVITADYEVLA